MDHIKMTTETGLLAHSMLIRIEGGVAFVEEGTVPFLFEISDKDNGDAPFDPQRIVIETERARAIVARTALMDEMGGVLRNAAGAIDSLMHQVDQMKGMFGDEDGAIAEAIESGEESTAEIGSALGRAELAIAGPASGLVCLTREDYQGLIDQLRTGRELVAEAMTVHIYGPKDEVPDDCNYGSFLREADYVLSLADSRVAAIAR